MIGPRFLFPDATAAPPPQCGGGVLQFTAPSPHPRTTPRRVMGNP